MSNKKQIQESFLREIAKNSEPFSVYLLKHFPLFKKFNIGTRDDKDAVTIIEHWVLSQTVGTVTNDMQYDRFTSIDLNYIRELYLKYKEDNNL